MHVFLQDGAMAFEDAPGTWIKVKDDQKGDEDKKQHS